MKKTLYVFICFNIIILNVCVVFASNSKIIKIKKGVLSDPIFGIYFNPNKLIFEGAPDAIYNCDADLKERKGDLFLFGKTIKGEKTYYLVYGWIEMGGEKGNVRHYTGEDDQGIIVVVSPDGCKYINGGFAWSPDLSDRQLAEQIGITSEVVNALLSDVVEREIKAFGGKRNFFRKLSEAGVDESSLPDEVQFKLQKLRQAWDASIIN